MADAVLWQILEAVRDGMMNDLVFDPMGDDPVKAIDRANAIKIRKVVEGKEHAKGYANELLPGILISPPLTVECDPSEGTNQRDDVTYRVLVQIIARDNETKDMNLRTYLKWQEQIRKYFNQRGLAAVQNAEGIVNRVLATQVDVVDERYWTRHRAFVAGVVLEIISREPRGVS